MKTKLFLVMIASMLIFTSKGQTDTTIMGSQKPFKITISKNYPIMVDYNQSLREMVDAGKYNWVVDDINTCNFPINGRGKINLNVVLITFKKVVGEKDSINIKDVLMVIDSAGFRQATLPELLALGKSFPNLQSDVSIFALGSSYKPSYADSRAPRLGEDSRGRLIHLCAFDFFTRSWNGSYGFLAVHK